MNNNEIKAAGPLGGLFPQEIVTARTRGYGPRRGNLERLLRYWRPIMRKPGGFRRCLAILANHPELYPLQRICAWLHHETTGLWPNEGCHHPGMKNCRSKLRNWSNAEFVDFMRTGKKPSNLVRSAAKKSARRDDVFFYDFKGADASEPMPVVTNSDFEHAMNVLADFMEMEKGFVDYLRNPDSWEFEGENEKGEYVTADFDEKSIDSECCGSIEEK